MTDAPSPPIQAVKPEPVVIRNQTPGPTPIGHGSGRAVHGLKPADEVVQVPESAK